MRQPQKVKRFERESILKSLVVLQEHERHVLGGSCPTLCSTWHNIQPSVVACPLSFTSRWALQLSDVQEDLAVETRWSTHVELSPSIVMNASVLRQASWRSSLA